MTQSSVPAKRGDTLDLAMFPGAQDAGDYGKITPAQAHALITWSKKYGLDAWAGHVCYMYGKPYVTEKGAIANAQQTGQYKGYATTPVGESRLAELGYASALVGWECTVIKAEQPQGITEYGVVMQSEIEELKEKMKRNVLSKNGNNLLSPEALEAKLMERLSYLPLFRVPSTIARMRAIRRAHLAAFPLQDAGTTREQLGGDLPPQEG